MLVGSDVEVGDVVDSGVVEVGCDVVLEDV